MSIKGQKTQNNNWNIWKISTIFTNKWKRQILYIDVAKELY